jgi:predicted TIM-barrel fold metal-dependent hydrolase
MIIDCHVHLNHYDEDVPPPPLRERVESLFTAMDEAEIDHAVVLSSYTANARRPHIEELVAEVAGHPRLSLVEGIRWRYDEQRTDLFQMEERIRAGVVKGIKLYPGYDLYAINDPSLESVFRIAAKYDVPVMIHTGDTYSAHAKVRYAHPLLVDDVAVDYPDVRFVACHLGNPWFQDCAEVLYKNDNVFADISGLTLGDFEYEFERYIMQRVRDMIVYMGEPGRQLMFGTDWPLAGMPSYVRFLEQIDVSAEDREHIAWETSAKLFRIDEAVLAEAQAMREARAETGAGADADAGRDAAAGGARSRAKGPGEAATGAGAVASVPGGHSAPRNRPGRGRV